MKTLLTPVVGIYVCLQPFMLFFFVDAMLEKWNMHHMTLEAKIERCLGQRTVSGYCYCMRKHGEYCDEGGKVDPMQNFEDFFYGEGIQTCE